MMQYLYDGVIFLIIGGIAALLLMGKLKGHFLNKKWSIYIALAILAASAFTSMPYIAPLMVHIFIIAPLLALLIWVCHHEVVKGTSQ